MNKKTISSITLLFISLLLFAQQEPLNQTDKSGKKQGHWIKKDEHGKPVYEGHFKDGKPVGEFKYYYDTGEIQTLSVFSANGSVCRTKHYFPGSILMGEGKYVNEKRDSVWKYYNAPNALVSEVSFKNGKTDGPEKNYDGKGKLMEEKNWKDSVLNGVWKKYYDDGTPQQEGTYNTGFLEGPMNFYYPGKVPAVVGQYQHSLKQGKWVYYNRTGMVIIQIENYYLGDLNGYYAEWSDKDGTPRLKGEFKQGKKNGKWTFFDEQGKLQTDSTFSLGYIHGVCTEYYENGNKKTESNYYYSHKTGKWTEWDEAGKITKEENFDSIEAVKKKMAMEEKERKKHPKLKINEQ
jgi:antitoxin component YwqK of YwqJK toxin-antitoxin module